MMNNTDFTASQHVPFLDHTALDWHNVRRTRFQFYQRFHYAYPGPIHNLRQRLIVIPAEWYAAQHVREHYLAITPSPRVKRQTIDAFGNRILDIEVSQADEAVTFEILLIIENEAQPAQLPLAEIDTLPHWSQSTRLTQPDERIEAVARQLQVAATTPYALAHSIHAWVYQMMRYQSGVTTVETTAAEALTLGQGLCQDYAHVMLAICRAAGLPARYVSGHLLGEGGSHAWVEVFLPTSAGFERVAFDPTNNRQPHMGYVTVAVGRDYHDVSPTSGSFTAPYGGQLTYSKRAGVTHIEYASGRTLQS
jgi:transglutaminase-like putative cysteine protease